MRDKFFFFSSFLETARELNDTEMQAKYLIAVAEYGLEWKENDDPIIRALMAQTKFTLDRSLEISEQKSESMKWNQNARKGFSSIKNNQNREKQRETEKNREKQKKQEVEVEVEVEDINIKEKINKKKKYWEFEKCLLTDEQYNQVITDYGEKNWNLLINQVDSYCASKGKVYKNYLATIRNFAKSAWIQKIAPPPPTNETWIYDLPD